MKKLTKPVSPFIMLLIPVFLLVALLAMNSNSDSSAEKQKMSIKLQVPTVKSIVKAVI
jgi:hypothetical protein